MRKLNLIFTFLIVLTLLPALVTAASISIVQSGAVPSTVMKDKTFTVSVSQATANAQATINLPTGFSLTGESTTKTTDSNGAVSWTTVVGSQTSTAQTVSVSISGQGSPETVTSNSFDVILPPSLSATISPTSVQASHSSVISFSLSLNIQNSGETTAQISSVSVSDGSIACPSSSVAGGQSSGVSCEISTDVSAGQTKTISLTAAFINTDPITKTITITGPPVAAQPSEAVAVGGGVAAKEYWVGELTTEGMNKELSVGDKIKFSLARINHTVILKAITATNATLEINSTPVNVTLLVGETKKLDLDNNQVYDLAVILNKIFGTKANVTLKAISEPIVKEKCPTCPSASAWSDCVAGKQTRTNYRCSSDTNYQCQSYTEEQTCKVVGPIIVTKRTYYFVIIVGVAVVIAIVFLFFLKRKSKLTSYH